jgi:hypothetical protein
MNATVTISPSSTSPVGGNRCGVGPAMVGIVSGGRVFSGGFFV